MSRVTHFIPCPTLEIVLAAYNSVKVGRRFGVFVFVYVRVCLSHDDEVLLHVHRNRRRIRTGAQDVHLDFHTAPELCV